MPGTPQEAYEALLKEMPENMLHLVKPYIESNYEAFEQEFSQAKSEYEPYKDVLQGMTPDQLQQARRFAEAYDQNPEDFLKRVATHLGYDLDDDDDTGSGQSSGNGNGNGSGDEPWRQEIQQLKDAVTQMGNTHLEDLKARQTKEQQQQFDEYLGNLRENNKDIWNDKAENFVVARISAGVDGDSAVKEYQELRNELLGEPTPNSDGSPKVIGSGNLPSNQRSVTELSENETTDLVAEIAKKAAEQST